MKRLSICSLLAITTLSLIALTVFSCDSDDDGTTAPVDERSANANANDASVQPELSRLEFPKVRGGKSEVIIHRTSEGINYSIEWDHDLRAQRWTCFEFYESNSVQKWARNNWKGTEWGGDPFQLDEAVRKDEQPSVKGEFSGSYYPDNTRTHYDRGHICASQDRVNSKDANEQTFYMTNMMPQVNVFNAGLWANLEAWVRSKNTRDFRDTLYVVKGGTIDKEKQVLARTKSGFIVPRYFFMAVLCKNQNPGNGGYKAIGFYVEHLNENHSNDNVGLYAVNVRELEQLTGLDFFCNLPDDIEEAVETLPIENVKVVWKLN